MLMVVQVVALILVDVLLIYVVLPLLTVGRWL